MSDDLLKDLKTRMEKAISALKHELSGLRAGRASVNLLDPIRIQAYGNPLPLNQVGTVNVPESRMLTVQVWDKNLVQATEKAIRESDLGLNPSTEGQVIRIPLPQLSKERREELVKIAGKYGEQARVSVRNVRREGMDLLKKMEKEESLSEDEKRRLSDKIQTLTDDYIKCADDTLASKEKDILQV